MGIMGDRFQNWVEISYLTEREARLRVFNFRIPRTTQTGAIVPTFHYFTIFSTDSSYRRRRLWYGPPCQLAHYWVRHAKCTWSSSIIELICTFLHRFCDCVGTSPCDLVLGWGNFVFEMGTNYLFDCAITVEPSQVPQPTQEVAFMTFIAVGEPD